MHEALNAMIFAWLLWRFVYILLHPYWMYDSRISQFDLRHVNQRRQINDSVFRLFDSFKWLITLRSIISPCQKATTIILIPLYNPSFDFWNHQKHLWALPYFCLGCLLKSATVTSFYQLHLSRNSGPRRSLEQINPHSISLYTRWLIKEAKKVWTTVVFLTAANHNVRNAHAVLMKRSYSVVGFRLTGWLNIVVFLPNVSVVIQP